MIQIDMSNHKSSNKIDSLSACLMWKMDRINKKQTQMEIVLTQFLIIVKSINWFRAVFFVHRSTWEMQRIIVERVNFRVQSIL